jgi:hypothetical protein
MEAEVVMTILTHMTYVCDGEDRVEHFPLFPMMITFVFHEKVSTISDEKKWMCQTCCG